MLICGDYELQLLLFEVLFRINNLDMIKLMAKEWFPERTLSTALVQVTSTDFDVECRDFLRLLNKTGGTVLTVVSLETFVDSQRLLPGKTIQICGDKKVMLVNFSLVSKTIDIQCSNVLGKCDDKWVVLSIPGKCVVGFNPEL